MVVINGYFEATYSRWRCSQGAAWAQAPSSPRPAHSGGDLILVASSRRQSRAIGARQRRAKAAGLTKNSGEDRRRCVKKAEGRKRERGNLGATMVVLDWPGTSSPGGGSGNSTALGGGKLFWVQAGDR